MGEFLLLLLGSEDGRSEALDFVELHWEPSFTPMLLEALTFNRDPAFASKLIRVLEDKTGQRFGFSVDRWQTWLWNQDLPPHSAYPEFKSALYGLIDERFEGYFGNDRASTIRLDEVVWGGVKQDGIPPLRDPDMVAAREAVYLAAHSLYQDRIGERRFIVLTDRSGASRVYESGLVEFTQWDREAAVVDTAGMRWQLEEASLRAEDGRILHRLPAHRAFWFGWFSAYSHTRLVH